MQKVKRVLVPVDFSEHTDGAVQQAIEFAKPYGAKLTLLYVNEPILSPESHLGDAPPDARAYFLKLLAELARKYTVESGPELDFEYISGTPADVIVELADERPFDFIVMNTHGRKGLKRWLLGSVAEKVVRGAACPVLTLRPQGREERASKTFVDPGI